MRVFEFLRAPAGPIYEAILDFALAHCPTFALEWHEGSDPTRARWNDLLPFAIDAPDTPGPDISLVKYRLTPESGRILQQADSLWHWDRPEPENLVFYAPNGEAFAAGNAHEEASMCNPTCFPEHVVRPFVEKLHAMGAAPHPGNDRHVPPHVFPDKSLDELRTIFQGDGPSAEVESQRREAFFDYWMRRLVERELPSEDEFAEMARLGFGLDDVIDHAATTDMLRPEDCKGLAALPLTDRASAALDARLLLENLQTTNGSEQEGWIDKLIAFVKDRNRRAGALTWAIYQALSMVDSEALEHLGESVLNSPLFVGDERSQYRRALDRRRGELQGCITSGGA